jgi:type VI secretion system secreted protein Hcp
MNIRILAFLLMLLPSASYAAVDMFLKIDDVLGESRDSVHGDEIDILAWSWGSSTNGRCINLQDVSVTKWVDLSSPTLLMGQIMGRVYDKATLTVRRAGRTPLEYIIIDFRNVYVSSISTGGSGGEDKLTENMTLNFESATYKYTPLTAEGSAGTTEEAEIYSDRGCR